mgnify:FL=1
MPDEKKIIQSLNSKILSDSNKEETIEWIESLDQIVKFGGRERGKFIVQKLIERAHELGAQLPFNANTPYVNSIARIDQPKFPGDRVIERKIKSINRWNALALVVKANKKHDGLGGHIATFQSAATLYQIGFNHFFKGKGDGFDGDQVFFQGHASPGMYAQAFLEGRLTEANMNNFRQELQKGGGLSSYPHPWLMPNFWEFPTVSMGLSPLSAIYQARFNHYLTDRGIKDTNSQQVWSFLGDGELDEPESLGAITLASREALGNLNFVINCNLQRLDGPVRGNGKVIQELETVFRGAGWNVIKVIWGSDWDPILEKDNSGLLVQRMTEVVDGDYQKYVVEDGNYFREHFFGKYPEVLNLVKNINDNDLKHLKRGGHDPEKVYAAFKNAYDCKNKPSVILAKTVKGYGMGDAGEGKNITHQQKKLNIEQLKLFRDRFDIPISDKEIEDIPFYKPKEGSEELNYLLECRNDLGGFVPQRKALTNGMDLPKPESYNEFYSGSERPVSTTMACVRLMSVLLKDKTIGKRIVPIVPDEARTFGMESFFRDVGIYSHIGQLYKPVDSDTFLYYKEAKDGQILEEGITEAGSMASFTAAGTAYSTHGVDMIPFFIYYSMFGFQRIGDFIWAFGDLRGRGFLLGATAGRTTLNGEGLQHQDGHSHILASTVPNIVAYDPSFACEIAVIIKDGLRRMYQDREDIFYYLTLHNENYPMPPLKKDSEDGILKGLYKFKSGSNKKIKAHVFGSGAIMNEVLKAQNILEKEYNVSVDVWSATSYKQLRQDALSIERWNLLNPNKPTKKPFVTKLLENEKGPFIAVSDYMKLISDQISKWVPGGIKSLGTDGFGRSDTREALRRHFEVDHGMIVVTVLYELVLRKQISIDLLNKAMKEFKINNKKLDPLFL